MATNKRVFTLRLSDEVFDKIGVLATKEHRSITNYIEYVLLKHLEEVEPKRARELLRANPELAKLSKAEYVNVANAIYIETINFLTRISARYSRLIAEPVAKLAGEVIDHAEKANSIYPSDDQRRQLRKAHLLEARASLMALDVRLTHCYLIMTQNPQGCFTTPSGKSVDAKKATERLDKMAQKLGELIDKENDLLQGMIGTVNRKA